MTAERPQPTKAACLGHLIAGVKKTGDFEAAYGASMRWLAKEEERRAHKPESALDVGALRKIEKRKQRKFEVVKLLTKQPGLTSPEIQAALDLTSYAIREYLRELSREGWIENKSRAGYVVKKEEFA